MEEATRGFELWEGSEGVVSLNTEVGNMKKEQS